jgi:hypothetical protein
MAVEQIPMDYWICTECEYSGPPLAFPVDTDGKVECPKCGTFDEIHN